MLPEFSVGTFVSLPTYFVYLSLLISLLFAATFKWAEWIDKDSKLALNLAMIIVVTGFVGGRLAHVIYESPEYYRRFPEAILMFWLGGYVFFGGMIFSAAAVATYVRWKKQPFWPWFDFLAPLFALGYGLGRFACFLAGCCYGGFCDLPWAVAGRHPTQIYALVLELGFAFFLGRRALKDSQERDAAKRWPVGAIALTWLALHAVGRMLMESYRADFRGAMPSGLSISTWASLILLSGALAGLTYAWWPRLQIKLATKAP